MQREKILKVTIHDCNVETFRVGGKGGQGMQKKSTGVRITHRPSGAKGECREERSQAQNKKIAFKRMAESDKFRLWARIEHMRIAEDLDKQIDKEMSADNLIIEYGPFD